MAARYANWSDVQWWLDQAAGLNYGEPDAATLQGFEDTQEAIFEDEVRGYVAVPISSTDSPDTFKRAKSICAMRGAADYLRYKRQTEGDVSGLWWEERLNQLADKMVGLLQSEATRADDHEVSADPVLVTPTFGGLPSTPAYTRDQVW